MFRQWALRADSGGAGWNRGGLGAVYEIELLEKQANVFLFGERGRFAPPGVLGGGEGALNRFRYEQDDGEHEVRERVVLGDVRALGRELDVAVQAALGADLLANRLELLLALERGGDLFHTVEGKILGPVGQLLDLEE